MKQQDEPTIQELQAELDAIIDWFESADVDIDEALVKYERGMALAKQLEQRLKLAENKITKLKEKFGE